MSRLDELPHEIEIALKREDQMRLRAAALLHEARQLCDAQGLGWQAWCTTNVNRSFRDVQRLLSIHRSPDPAAALETSRREAREGMRAVRARTFKATNVSRSEKDRSLAAIKKAVLALTRTDQVHLLHWLDARLTELTPDEESVRSPVN